MFGQTFGAVGDAIPTAGQTTLVGLSASDSGVTNAAAINAALLAAKTAGGGTVSVTDPGTYLLAAIDNPYASGRKCLLDFGSGTSNVTLFIGPGVILKMADSQQVDGAPVDLVVWEDGTNLRITGGGTITGNTAGQSGWTQSSGENGTKYGQVTPGGIVRGFSSTSVYETYESNGVTLDNIRLTDHFGNAFDITGVKNFTANNVYAENCGEGPQFQNCARVVIDGVRYVDTGIRTAVTPSSTDTGTDTLTFSSDPTWTTGSYVLATTTGGGLTAGTAYWYRRVTATTGTLHTSQAGAIAGTGLVNLTASITSVLTGTNRVTQGDGIEGADCVGVTITNCYVDGYINGSAYDFAGCKSVAGAGNGAEKCNSGFDGGSPSGFASTSDNFAFSDFVFKNMYGTTVLVPAKGRCTFSNFVIADCTNAVGIQIPTGEAGDDGLCEFVGGTVNGCTTGLLAQLETAAVNRKVKVTGGSYSGNSSDGIRLGRASTGLPEVSIIGVTATGNGRYGFCVDGQGTSFTPTGLVSGCDFTGNTTAPMICINSGSEAGLTVAACIPNEGTTSSPSFLGLQYLTLATNLGNFGPGSKNQRITVRNSNGYVIIDASQVGGVNVRLVGATNYTFASAYSSLTVEHNGIEWVEFARTTF